MANAREIIRLAPAELAIVLNEAHGGKSCQHSVVTEAKALMDLKALEAWRSLRSVLACPVA